MPADWSAPRREDAYWQVWREAGRVPGTEQVQMSFDAYLADTHRDAVAGSIPAMRTYLDVFTEAVSSWED